MTELVQPPVLNLATVIQYAEKLQWSTLLPKQYHKQPGNIMWAVEYGRTLGISPVAAIMGINVIQGKPSASAALISGLVRRAGHTLRVRLEHDEQGFPVGVAELVRKDDPDHPFISRWTIERAVRAGLCRVVDGKVVAKVQDGQGLSWERYPENLVKWRAVTEVARDGCEEALFGLHYTAEELGAEVDEEGAVVVEQASLSTGVDEVVEDAVIVPDEPAEPAKRQGKARSKDDIFSVSELVTRIYNADPSEIQALFLEAEQRGVLEETTLDREQQPTTVRGLLVQRQMDASAEGEK